MPQWPVRVDCEHPCSWLCSAVEFSACGGNYRVIKQDSFPWSQVLYAKNQTTMLLCPISDFLRVSSVFSHTSVKDSEWIFTIFSLNISQILKFCSFANAWTQLPDLCVSKARTENLFKACKEWL